VIGVIQMLEEQVYRICFIVSFLQGNGRISESDSVL
jgi:hypothetical protein